MAIGIQTYTQGDLRESLLDILRDASPLGGNWLMGNLGTSEASQPYHQWDVFNIDRPTSVTYRAEGFDATVVDLTTPSKSGNYTAIIDEVVQVTGSNIASTNALYVDPLTFQKEKRLSVLNAKMEFTLVNGAAPVSGASGVARNMAGLDGVISTNVTARASGTSFTSTELEDILQDTWDKVGSEFVANTMLVPMVIKRRISSFTTNVTNYTSRTDKLFNNVSVYEASTGVVEIVSHKDVRNAAGTVTVYAINPEMYKAAYLRGRQPFWKDLAESGDYKRGMYLTEMTMESLNERTSAKRTGYSRAL